MKASRGPIHHQLAVQHAKPAAELRPSPPTGAERNPDRPPSPLGAGSIRPRVSLWGQPARQLHARRSGRPPRTLVDGPSMRGAAEVGVDSSETLEAPRQVTHGRTRRSSIAGRLVGFRSNHPLTGLRPSRIHRAVSKRLPSEGCFLFLRGQLRVCSPQLPPEGGKKQVVMGRKNFKYPDTVRRIWMLPYLVPGGRPTTSVRFAAASPLQAHQGLTPRLTSNRGTTCLMSIT
jgi:hypothetical protein